MNYSGNMPDWHQYNPQQSGINNITSTAQNVNSGHLSFISSISPTCSTQLNLSSEGLEKHQNDPNFNPRHFQPHLPSNIAHGHNAADNTPLASMVQMQNCIGHYGPASTRNPMVDNLNGPMDPRGTAMSGLNEELGYRNNQVPLNGPISHLNGPSMMSMNAPHAPMGPRNANVSSHANRTGPPPPSFVPCKGPCCNPDPNMSYQQWEKYCSYQNNTAYRENIRTSAGYQADARRAFGNESFNFRKDNFDGKEVLSPMVPPPNTDHRRNFADFKYRKERMIPRSYPASSSMLQNYPVQNYNYNAGEYQKYPYNIKEYSKVGGMNVPPSQAMVKHQEQGFAMPQQKYNSKPVSYQSNAGVMPGSMPSTSVPPNPGMIPSAQNTYFNSQYPRNLPADVPHDCQEAAADGVSMVNRMQAPPGAHAPPHTRYQMYQQKLAMQKFTMENDLRELSRIPGYQSHPRYKEYVHKYREILKLQQSVAYQGQQVQQTSSCVAATSSATTSTVPSINLQFDQNGVLINSNYMPEAFSRMQQVNPQAPIDVTVDKQGKPDGAGGGSVAEMAGHNIQKPEQLVSQQHDGHAIALCSEVQKQDRAAYPAPKDLDQNQFEVQKTTGGESFGGLGASDAQHKMTKEFPDKPELDVRQFLANWDESEDEDGTGAALPGAVLSESTPVVVVGYENLSAKTLESLEVAKPEGLASGMITFGSQDKSDGVVPAQDCLTISYSTAEEIAKDSAACKEITKEGIVRAGGHIIQCISNGPDEVPTIHIVDNLEIGSILQVTNGQVGEALGRQDAVSFFQEGTEPGTAITLETGDKVGDESAAAEYNNDGETLNKEKYTAESSSLVDAAEAAPQASQANDQKAAAPSAPAKDHPVRDANLRKQSSFASEESHNPDDISLPDLPTSECTPISTALNTPIHSDSEESSERVRDLTISTNPIEVMHNSPIISFAQSPTKERLYDHLSDEKTAKSGKPAEPLGDGEYRAEARFKNDDEGALDRDAVLDAFEFPASTDAGGGPAAKTGEHCGDTAPSTSANEEAFSLSDAAKSTEVADMRVTLASGEYELKIVSAHKSALRAHKNSTANNRLAGESQVVAVVQDASLIHRNAQAEAGSKLALRHGDSIELENALQNITGNAAPLDRGASDVIYSEKCATTELARQTDPISLSLAGDAADPGTAIEDGCTAKGSESDPLTSPGKKHSSGDKIKRRQHASDKFSREDSLARKDANKSANVDAKDSRQPRRAKLEDCKKSKEQAVSAGKRCSESAERCGETTRHSGRLLLTEEAESHRGVEGARESGCSRGKPRVIGNVRVDDAAERMRLLKEYRRIKSRPSGDAPTESKDAAQEACDRAASNKCHLPSSSVSSERSVSRLPSDKHACQRDTARHRPPEDDEEEEERKHPNILKTLVATNVNPDFAIQVTNVNLKLKDTGDHQKDLPHLGENGKNNSSLDGIKIEINVSCTERNTTEKLLHENIKNAVAETIGHLTGSISSGTRSGSTSITELPCDKRTTPRDSADRRDHERHRALGEPASKDVLACDSVTRDQGNADETRHKSVAYEKDAAGDEASASLAPGKGRSLSSERRSTSDADDGNINVKTDPAASGLEAPKSEHAVARRRSIHQDVERRPDEESMTFSDNPKSVNAQKKEHQEIVPPLCRGARSAQDDVASRASAIPSTSSGTANPEGAAYENAAHFDYDHFDVAPNESADTSDKRADRWKRPRREDGRFGSFDLHGEIPSGYVNPSFFSADRPENLNAVPVYTTKDGKITYSPNPRMYRKLLREARAREGHARSPPHDYYNCSKSRKIFKKGRDVADRKREADDVRLAARHADYPPPRSAAHRSAHCKFRGASHLEFFNDDADKLYASKGAQQDAKESAKRNIIDLNFLEKQFNLDGEASSRHGKTKADKPERGYSESSVFDSSLFPGPRTSCWEETMESVKSYSSHVDRRNSDGLKELNFSEIFARKRLDTLSFLSAERMSGSHEVSYAESLRQDIDRPQLLQDSNLPKYERCTVSREEQNKENNKSDASMAEVDGAKSATTSDASLTERHNEPTEKQEPRSDEAILQSSAILFTEEARSPRNADERSADSERDQRPTGVNDKEVVAEHPVEGNTRTIFPTENNFEDAEQASDKNPVEDANMFELNTNPKDPFDEGECTETAKEPAFSVHEQDKIKDAARDNLECAMSQETLCRHVTADRKDEEDASAPEPDISARVDQTAGGENDSCTKEQPVVPQDSLDVVPASRSLDDEVNEQRPQMFESEEQATEIPSRDEENDEVDNCGLAVTSEPAIESVCDLFTDERREQNISEFTVVKSVIRAADRKQRQEEECEREGYKDRDSVIDPKLLCMDSSDCGIYMEDRCASDLMQLPGHEFNEDDTSMVLMKWEAGRIQEDAVNRLCGIGDASLDFAGMTNALQDNSLLDNLSISRTLIVREPRVETIATTELDDKSNSDEAAAPAAKSAPAAEESDRAPSDDEANERRDQAVSSGSGYEKLAYLRATDCNANTKMVPKLVIKKTETSSKFVTQMGSSSVAQVDHKSSPNHQPKIPKMIIRNARSRPGTPSIESVRENVPQMSISDRITLTNEEAYENESEGSLQDGYRNKIPKMKIKLDEKHSSKIVRTEDDADEDSCARRKSTKKTIPKMKIKNSSRTDLSECTSKPAQESSRRCEERIPILKLRKQERSSSPEVTRKRSSSGHAEVPSKRYRKAGRDDASQPTGRSSSSDSTRGAAAECEARKNPQLCISEKIPKVIIKRTSASAEFRCELSKDCKKIIAKSAKWQPEVKLERYRNLDSMLKDLKLTLSPMSLRAVEKIFAGRKDGWDKGGEHSLARSSSTSNLIPVKYNKQRRMSDYECRKISDSLKVNPASWSADSEETKTCASPKKSASSKSKSADECRDKSKPRRSRSRDGNPRTEDVAPFDKESDQSLGLASEVAVSQHDKERESRGFEHDLGREHVARTDEDSTALSNLSRGNISVERPGDLINFKTALKDTSNAESCFVKLPNLREMTSERSEPRTNRERKTGRDDDPFPNGDKSKIVIKKERLSISDIDNDDSTLQGDIDSFRDAPVTMEDNNFVAGNAVIKIESSDESQSTIEILPASPDDDRGELESHMIENDDNDEHLYSADAIPTQFELELEITDNSNTDLLDVPMPRLDPVACSRRVFTEEPSGDRHTKAGRCGKSESSPRDSIGRENDDVTGDDRSTLKSRPAVSDAPSRTPCETSGFTATRENFCCNDSLIKEVLAAKEALKKCLSLSRCESGAKSTARPKTAAEKKQGLSFDLNSLSETQSKSGETPQQGCHGDVAIQRSCVSATSEPSKTESTSNIEKSDKEYSGQSKSSSVRRKSGSRERSEKADSKEATKRPYEYTTISLKAVKRFDRQAASDESRAVNQNERRKTAGDQNHGAPQSRDAQRDSKLSSYKIPKISKSAHPQESNAGANAKVAKKTKEDNMPILEPEVDVNLDASSDRDTSRSPPVITIHDDLDVAESKLIDDNVITTDNKVEGDAKDVHKKGEMSVADFITQLAYHEKATIRHRRYCNLCERWFPNTVRHQRHLTGYQHRHIELTQRRSIHALFMLFTGKPCPTLPPADVVRDDCSVGELTPLQIAIQDITKCYDRAQQSPKKQNDK